MPMETTWTTLVARAADGVTIKIRAKLERLVCDKGEQSTSVGHFLGWKSAEGDAKYLTIEASMVF